MKNNHWGSHDDYEQEMIDEDRRRVHDEEHEDSFDPECDYCRLSQDVDGLVAHLERENYGRK